MLASDLQTSLPLINRLTNTLTAGRLVAHSQPAGLVLADDHGQPETSVSASDVLAMLVSGSSDEHMHGRTDDVTIGQAIDSVNLRLTPLHHVRPDSSVSQVAREMVARGSIVALVDGDDERPAFVTLPAVLEAVVVLHGDGRD